MIGVSLAVEDRFRTDATSLVAWAPRPCVRAAQSTHGRGAHATSQTGARGSAQLRSSRGQAGFRRAFTLIEMVTSCAILSLLMLALGYGLKLALVSTGNGATQAAAAAEATGVVERVSDDLNEALNFTEKTAEAVTFTVPNRAATTQPAGTEIRYQWWPTGGTVETGLLATTTGLLGGLLPGPTSTSNTVPQYAVTRQVNGGTPSVLARDVRAFNLNYLYRSMSPAAPAADQLLLQHDPDLTIGTPAEFQLSTLWWIGETFLMPLPAGTTSYTITRVALYLRADTTLDGVLIVKVYPADAVTNTPITTQAPLEEVWIPEVALTNSMGWLEVPFTKLTNLNPSQKYCVLITGTGTAGNYHAVAGFVNHPLPPLTTILAPDTYLVQTTTGAAPWTTSSSNSLRYKVYGVTSP